MITRFQKRFLFSRQVLCVWHVVEVILEFEFTLERDSFRNRRAQCGPKDFDEAWFRSISHRGVGAMKTMPILLMHKQVDEQRRDGVRVTSRISGGDEDLLRTLRQIIEEVGASAWKHPR